MLRNELRERRVEAVRKYVVWGAVEGHWVAFAVPGLVREGQPVGDEVVGSFEVLGAEDLFGLCHKKCDLAGDELYGCVVRRVCGEACGSEYPSDRRRVIAKAQDGFFG
jgi:hypothetical protein